MTPDKSQYQDKKGNPHKETRRGVVSSVYINNLMPNRFSNIFSNDSSALPGKSTFSGAVDGTVYGLNEGDTVIKIKETLIIILLVL